jgi:hypothetical protein
MSRLPAGNVECGRGRAFQPYALPGGGARAPAGILRASRLPECWANASLIGQTGLFARLEPFASHLLNHSRSSHDALQANFRNNRVVFDIPGQILLRWVVDP